MQRVLQRTARARRGALKKAERKKDIHEKDEAWNDRTSQEFRLKLRAMQYRESRTARRDDWELGPIAPRRDIGEQAETYGTVNVYAQQLPPRPKRDRVSVEHLREGDRVVIIRGLQKGNIDYVTETNEESCSVALKNSGRVDLALAHWMSRAFGGKEGELVQEGRLQYNVEDVRLVYPLKDEKTGVPRDVIIEKVEFVDNKPYVDEDGVKRFDGGTDKFRVIPGTNTIIPWPVEGEQPAEEEYDLDTLVDDVEHITFDVPPLLSSPMPVSVVDELRNKYSKFRTRHDWDFIEKKNAQDAETAARSNLINKMKTPLQQLNELRAQKRAAEQKELSEEQLSIIGQIMAGSKVNAVDGVKDTS